MTKKCYENSKSCIKVELNSTSIVPKQRQAKILSVNFDLERQLPLKSEHKVLENLSRRTLVLEGGFESHTLNDQFGKKGVCLLQSVSQQFKCDYID